MPAPPGVRNRVCSGKFRAIVGAHLTPVRAQPLLQLHTHFGFNGRGVRAWLDAADQLQPVGVVLVEIGVALDERFGVQRQKEIGRSAAQSVAKETRRSDSHYRKWLVIQIEDAADDGRIRSIPLLPQAIAHHGDRRCAGAIILSRKRASGIRSLCRTWRSNCRRRTRPDSFGLPPRCLSAGHRTAAASAGNAANSEKPLVLSLKYLYKS